MPSQADYTALLIGAGALVLLGKWAIPTIPDPVAAAKGFVPNVIGGGRKGSYIEDQSGLSPNPPTEEWWNDYSGDLGGGWSRRDRGPIDVPVGTAIPTPPVVELAPISGAEVAGQQTHKWFTNPVLYPWFYLADKL